MSELFEAAQAMLAWHARWPKFPVIPCPRMPDGDKLCCHCNQLCAHERLRQAVEAEARKTLGLSEPARLGTARGKRLRGKARQIQGFELNPPRCVNCDHLVAPKHGTPESPHGRKQPYIAMACGLGNFQVVAWSICDRWKGRDGDELEAP